MRGVLTSPGGLHLKRLSSDHVEDLRKFLGQSIRRGHTQNYARRSLWYCLVPLHLELQQSGVRAQHPEMPGLLHTPLDRHLAHFLANLKFRSCHSLSLCCT